MSVVDQFSTMSGGHGTYVVTNSARIQRAKEKEEDRNGVFTKHLLEGLRSGAADLDGDGYITMNEVYAYVQAKMTAEGHQEPMKWGSNVGGELIIANSGQTPRKDRYKKIREHLLSLASRGTIGDDLLSEALKIAAKPGRELDPREFEYDQLLDDVMAKKLSVGEFVRQWYAILGIRDLPEEVAQRKAAREAEAKRKAEEEELKHATAERQAEEKRKREKAAKAERQAEKASAASEQVFVCYARKDKQFVLALARKLSDAGIPIWLDQWEIMPGADWDGAIDEALDSSPRFLIVLSPASIESLEVKGELHTALEQRKAIIPIVHEECRIPRQLLTVQRVTMQSEDLNNETILEQLCSALTGPI